MDKQAHPSLDEFKKLSHRQQEAVLFYSRQLQARYKKFFCHNKHQQGLGEIGSIELAIKLVNIVGNYDEIKRKKLVADDWTFGKRPI